MSNSLIEVLIVLNILGFVIMTNSNILCNIYLQVAKLDQYIN